MSKKVLKVAIIAPPWLPIPPPGYGGIENVLESLIVGLRDRDDVQLELFTIRETRIRGVKIHALYKKRQYMDIHRPMYDALPILAAHIQFALHKIVAAGDFDIIHDHNGYYGPHLLGWAASADRCIPPVIHTHHGPPFSTEQMLAQGLPDNRLFWKSLKGAVLDKLYFVGISDALMKPAPIDVRRHSLLTVYNAVHLENFIYREKKLGYFITLARFSRDKAQHVAVDICTRNRYRLLMAGTVASIETPSQLSLEIANPLSPFRNNPDFKYYSDMILPNTIHNKRIRYVGNVSGQRKKLLIANAKALLFPIDWEEPFGMAVIEALASGTPVVAMARGAMPEIIEHGRNGFLAQTVEEFEEYVARVGEIDPAECRRSVEERFSAGVMADAYLDRYRAVVAGNPPTLAKNNRRKSEER